MYASLAAKILVLAGRAQQEEIGDGANLTISFAGELLEKAEELIRMGLHPSKIIIGYTKAETAGKESSSCGLHRYVAVAFNPIT
jgi:chaperonin GroEL (HSP60 family)